MMIRNDDDHHLLKIYSTIYKNLNTYKIAKHQTLRRYVKYSY